MSVYGIDFGYSEACIAAMEKNGAPHMIRNVADTKDKLDCAVFFESEDNVMAGGVAKDMALIGTDADLERIVMFLKRELCSNNPPRWEFDGRSYSPTEMCALIFNCLRQLCEEQGCSAQDVVVTCPAWFGVTETSALINAAEMANFRVKQVISEPIAAAYAYLYAQGLEAGNILVYDLGGSSFDVTVLNITRVTDANGNTIPNFRILAMGGNDRLGGRDWDDRLYDHILQVFSMKNGISPDEIEVESRRQIRSYVELTKKKLSNAERAKVRANVNGSVGAVAVSRGAFEAMTSDLVAQTMTYVEETLQSAGGIEIDTVLLVGGSAYMPMIRNAVETRFPGKVQMQEPDLAVAKGAALYGQMLTGYNPFPPVKPRKTSLYSPNLIASMIRYAIDHSHDDLAKELISEVDWGNLTAEELFDFFYRIRNLLKE